MIELVFSDSRGNEVLRQPIQNGQAIECNRCGAPAIWVYSKSSPLDLTPEHVGEFCGRCAERMSAAAQQRAAAQAA